MRAASHHTHDTSSEFKMMKQEEERSSVWDQVVQTIETNLSVLAVKLESHGRNKPSVAADGRAGWDKTFDELVAELSASQVRLEDAVKQRVSAENIRAGNPLGIGGPSSGASARPARVPEAGAGPKFDVVKDITPRAADEFLLRFRLFMGKMSFPEMFEGRNKWIEVMSDYLSVKPTVEELLFFDTHAKSAVSFASFEQHFKARFVKDRSLTENTTRYRDLVQGDLQVDAFGREFKKRFVAENFPGGNAMSDWSSTTSLGSAECLVKLNQGLVEAMLKDHMAKFRTAKDKVDTLLALAEDVQEELLLRKVVRASMAKNGKADAAGKKEAGQQPCTWCQRQHAGGEAACRARKAGRPRVPAAGKSAHSRSKDNKDAKSSPGKLNKLRTAEEQKVFDECREAGICYNFSTAGKCPFGEKCRFTHERAGKRQQSSTSSTKECRLCGSGAHTAATCPSKAGKPKALKVTIKRERRGSDGSGEESEDSSDDRPLKRHRE